MVRFSVDECWLRGWRGASVLEADERGIRISAEGARPDGHLAGTVLPGFRDSHVHLGLADGRALLAGGIAAADDFGWIPAVASAWPGSPELPEVRIAGAFLTCVGGYPSDREWAPEGAVDEVTRDTARAAVARQRDAGASFVKVVLNSDAGPVLDDTTLGEIVARAHSLGMLVAAHVEGTGQAVRALEAKVDRLAHAPFNERLDDDVLGAMADSMVWVSTLDIHGWGDYGEEFALAHDNVARFYALGGTVRYGTDLGNGPLPVGINARELRALADAGLGTDALIDAIAPTDFGLRLSHTPSTPDADTAGWLTTASVLDHSQIKELLE